MDAPIQNKGAWNPKEPGSPDLSRLSARVRRGNGNFSSILNRIESILSE